MITLKNIVGILVGLAIFFLPLGGAVLAKLWLERNPLAQWVGKQLLTIEVVRKRYEKYQRIRAKICSRLNRAWQHVKSSKAALNACLKIELCSFFLRTT
jgi:hypothetical protein